MNRKVRKLEVCLWALLVCLVFITRVQTAKADTSALADWSGVEYADSSYAYYTLAYKFTVGDSPITVTKLGVFDYGADGLIDSHDVAIWEEGNTNAVARVTVATNSPAEGPIIGGSNCFRYEPVSEVTLYANTSYRIGAYYHKLTGGYDLHARNGSETVSDRITYDGPCLKGDVDLDRGLAYPDGASTRSSGYFGPNFQFKMAADKIALTGWSTNVEYSTSSFAYYTLGWRFTVRGAPVVVSKLGVFDYSADGLVDNHEVAIWEDGNTNPLTRVTVTPSSPIEGPSINSRGKFRYEVTSGLVLRSNVTYRIGAYYDKLTGSADQNARGPAGLTSATQSTDNAIIYVGNCFIGDPDNYQPLTYPSNYATTRYTGYFGPNFRFSMAPPGTLIRVQ